MKIQLIVIKIKILKRKEKKVEEEVSDKEKD